MESKCCEAVSEKWISYQEKGQGSLGTSFVGALQRVAGRRANSNSV